MKDKYIYYHPIRGFITSNDLVEDLKRVLKNYKTLEDIVITILENFQFDDETIASLFTCNIASKLEDIINILQNELL